MVVIGGHRGETAVPDRAASLTAAVVRYGAGSGSANRRESRGRSRLPDDLQVSAPQVQPGFQRGLAQADGRAHEQLQVWRPAGPQDADKPAYNRERPIDGHMIG